MNRSKRAKYSLISKSGAVFSLSRDTAKPLKTPVETMVPIITLAPHENPEATLEELKEEAKNLGIKGYNFFKKSETLRAKIVDQIRLGE